MAQPQIMEDHSSQGALQLQIQCLDLGGKCIWQETLHQSSTCKRGLAVEQGAKNEPFLHHFPIKMRRHSVPLAQDYRTVQH